MTATRVGSCRKAVPEMHYSSQKGHYTRGQQRPGWQRLLRVLKDSQKTPQLSPEAPNNFNCHGTRSPLPPPPDQQQCFPHPALYRRGDEEGGNSSWWEDFLSLSERVTKQQMKFTLHKRKVTYRTAFHIPQQLVQHIQQCVTGITAVQEWISVFHRPFYANISSNRQKTKKRNKKG